jgi:hypothetical protein
MLGRADQVAKNQNLDKVSVIVLRRHIKRTPAVGGHMTQVHAIQIGMRDQFGNAVPASEARGQKAGTIGTPVIAVVKAHHRQILLAHKAIQVQDRNTHAFLFSRWACNTFAHSLS